MKLPFVARTRLETEIARLSARVARTRTQAERAKQRAMEAKEKLERRDHRIAELAGKLEQERERGQELEGICEIRAHELEDLREFISQRERHFAEVERMAELQGRQVTLLLKQIAATQHSHSLVLGELVRTRRELRQSQPEAGTSPAKRGRVPVVLGVDIEPDGREVDRDHPSWDGAATFFQRLPALRESLQQVAGQPVPFSWFPRADPQVEIANGDASYALRRFADEWRALQVAGDEIGLHVHAWRWHDAQSRWNQDHDNHEWVSHCVRSAMEAYRSFFGEAPASYRGGDRFLSNAVAALIEELGVRVDLSLELAPETERLVGYELSTGSIPDTSKVPNRAYRPSAADFRIPDPVKKTGLGMMPLTGYPGGQLSPWIANVDFENALDLLLMEEGDLTHLAFVVRADISMVAQWDDFVANSHSLARRVRDGRLEFTTAIQAWERAALWIDLRE